RWAVTEEVKYGPCIGIAFTGAALEPSASNLYLEYSWRVYICWSAPQKLGNRVNDIWRMSRDNELMPRIASVFEIVDKIPNELPLKAGMKVGIRFLKQERGVPPLMFLQFEH